MRNSVTAYIVAILGFPFLNGEEISVLAQDDWGLTRPREPASRPVRPHRPARPVTSHPVEPNEEANRESILIERYHSILRRDPAHTFAFQRLLDLYRSRDGHLEKLKSELEQKIKAEPTDDRSRFVMARVYEEERRYDDAALSYEQVLRTHPDDVNALRALARVEKARGHIQRAMELLEHALEKTPRQQQSEPLSELAHLALDQNQFEQARRYFERIQQTTNASAFLKTEYARALAARGQHARAVEEFTRALQSLRGDQRVLAPILREKGLSQMESGDYEGAATTFRRAMDASGQDSGLSTQLREDWLESSRRAHKLPELAAELVARRNKDAATLTLLGRVQEEIGDETKAMESYRQAIRRSANLVDTRLRLIHLLSRAGRVDEVIEEYRSLSRIAPSEPKYVIELAQLLVQAGRKKEALEMVAQAGTRNREPRLHQALAEFYARMGEDEKATAELARLAHLAPNEPDYLIQLGNQQFDAGHRETALVTWSKLIHTEHDQARAYATLGNVLADHDMLDAAVENLREAVRREPESLEYSRSLASALERSRREEEALAVWQKVLELSTQDRSARREARQRMIGIWTRTRTLTNHAVDLERKFTGPPPDIEAGRFLAEVYRRIPDHMVHAERTLRRITELDAGDIDSLTALEQILSKRGERAEAIKVLEKLVQAEPRRAASHLQRMAEHALALYHDEDAVRFAAMSVERAPDDASAHERLGDLYRSRQDLEHAIASYRKAVELNDRLFDAMFDLAELYVERDQLSEAASMYEKVIRSCPDDDLVARAARASMQLGVARGSLQELEQELFSLAVKAPFQRPIFRKLLVELYAMWTGVGSGSSTPSSLRSSASEESLQAIGHRAVKPLLEALADSDPAQRSVAIEVLSVVRHPTAVLPLLAVAESTDTDIMLRARALAAAGAVAGPEHVARFVQLAKGPERRLRALAAWTLARMNNAVSARAMQDLLDSNDPRVRTFAALGLGVAHQFSAEDFLTRRLREDRHVDVRASAALALGLMQRVSAAPPLQAAFAQGPAPVTRASAIALGWIADGRVSPMLAEGLFHPDPNVRRASAAALVLSKQNASQRPAVELTLPTALGEPSVYLDGLMAKASNRAGEPIHLEPYRENLFAAVAAALKGNPAQIITALSVLASREAEREIGLGDITLRLHAWPQDLRDDANRTLIELGKHILPDLKTLLSHSDAFVRAKAVRVMAIVDPSAEDSLIAALEDADAKVRRAALSRFSPSEGTTHDAAVTRLATAVLRDSDWGVRMEAARTLGGMRRTSAIGSLITALKNDPFAYVRRAAAMALGEIGSSRALPSLTEAKARDADAAVRSAAHQSLRRLSNHAADGVTP